MMVSQSAEFLVPPDFFVTFACNINWNEISLGILEPGQKPSDRANIIVRVYNMKLEEMLDDIRSGRIFGSVAAGTFKYSSILTNIHS